MYSAKINGQPTTFGTSGMLYQSNKLMYDRTTNSLWNQFTGEPIAGPLASSGMRLPYFASVVTTWEDWLAEHPDTTVLSLETGIYDPSTYTNEWEPDAIYHKYFASPDTMFPVFNRDTTLAPKQTVIGVNVGDAFKAYATSAFSVEPVINDVVGGRSIVLVGSSLFGTGRVYERNGQTFTEDGDGLLDESGTRWTIGEVELTEVGGTGTLARIPTITSFWHGWFSFHPDTALYQSP